MAQTCPKCGRENSDTRVTCKECHTPLRVGATIALPVAPISTAAKINRILPLIALGIVVVLCGLGWAMTRNQPLSEGAQSRLAYDFCKRDVEGQLIAPATAEFADYNDVVVEKNRNVHRFTGQVDSENRLGVPIRLTFICNVEENSRGEFRVNDAVVLEP